MGVHLDDTACDRRHDQYLGRAVLRLDGQPGPDDETREDGVGHVGEGHHLPREGRVHHRHRRSWTSSASESASGPTTIWTTLPATITPWAPRRLSAAWSTFAGSATSVRSRVMQPSTSTMSPPHPGRPRCHSPWTWISLSCRL